MSSSLWCWWWWWWWQLLSLFLFFLLLRRHRHSRHLCRCGCRRRGRGHAPCRCRCGCGCGSDGALLWGGTLTTTMIVCTRAATLGSLLCCFCSYSRCDNVHISYSRCDNVHIVGLVVVLAKRYCSDSLHHHLINEFVALV